MIDLTLDIWPVREIIRRWCAANPLVDTPEWPHFSRGQPQPAAFGQNYTAYQDMRTIMMNYINNAPTALIILDEFIAALRRQEQKPITSLEDAMRVRHYIGSANLVNLFLSNIGTQPDHLSCDMWDDFIRRGLPIENSMTSLTGTAIEVLLNYCKLEGFRTRQREFKLRGELLDRLSTYQPSMAEFIVAALCFVGWGYSEVNGPNLTDVIDRVKAMQFRYSATRQMVADFIALCFA